MLVEDNRVNQLFAVELLKSYGVKVKVVGNGLQALSYLQEHQNDSKIDCIFMDCEMPEMDGFEASKAIRHCAAGAHYVHTPIIAMTTALSMPGDKDKCISAGMNGYISKPVDETLFYNKLKAWLA